MFDSSVCLTGIDDGIIISFCEFENIMQHHVSKYCDTIIKKLLTSKKFSIFYINLATTDDAVIVKIT